MIYISRREAPTRVPTYVVRAVSPCSTLSSSFNAKQPDCRPQWYWSSTCLRTCVPPLLRTYRLLNKHSEQDVRLPWKIPTITHLTPETKPVRNMPSQLFLTNRTTSHPISGPSIRCTKVLRIQNKATCPQLTHLLSCYQRNRHGTVRYARQCIEATKIRSLDRVRA